MDKQVNFEFAPSLFLRDTRLLDAQTKGITFELFLHLRVAEGKESRMEISATAEEFARLLRCDQDAFLKAIRTVFEKNIFSAEDEPSPGISGAPIISVSIYTHNLAYAW